MLDHHWISSLVPSDSQFFQHPVSQPSGFDSATPPTTTDGALVCSQSLENLNLSDMAIPGLHTVRRHADAADVAADPEAETPVAESFASETSVTAKIPGAYPKSRKDQARPALAAVEEASVEWNANGNEPGPSRGMPSPATFPVKRKSNLIEGSSPLSSLSSSEADASPKKPVVRRAVPPRSKGKAVETKRRLHAAPSAGAKQRRAAGHKGAADSSEDERPPKARRGAGAGTGTGSRRQPAAKAARYA